MRLWPHLCIHYQKHVLVWTDILVKTELNSITNITYRLIMYQCKDFTYSEINTRQNSINALWMYRSNWILAEVAHANCASRAIAWLYSWHVTFRQATLLNSHQILRRLMSIPQPWCWKYNNEVEVKLTEKNKKINKLNKLNSYPHIS